MGRRYSWRTSKPQAAESVVWRRLRNRQLKQNRGTLRPASRCFSPLIKGSAALSRRRRLPLWMSISSSETRPTDSAADERRQSDKQGGGGKKLRASRKEVRLADEQKRWKGSCFSQVRYIWPCAHILTGLILWNASDRAHFDRWNVKGLSGRAWMKIVVKP